MALIQTDQEDAAVLKAEDAAILEAQKPIQKETDDIAELIERIVTETSTLPEA